MINKSETRLNREKLSNYVKRKVKEVLCDRQHKQIHQEIQSQYFPTLTYKAYKILAETITKHAPTNCFSSQQILKKLIKFISPVKAFKISKELFLLSNHSEKRYCNVFL